MAIRIIRVAFVVGVPLPQPNTPSSPFGYTGEWTDAATGLQYLRARWYDPATGRFTQVDPFAGLLSLPGTQHPYAYALNNPLRYTDPSGEFVGALLGGVAALRSAVKIKFSASSSLCKDATVDL